MTDDVLTRVTLGVTHHLLCPEIWTDGEAHERTLLETVLPLDIDGVDLFGPPDLAPARILREADALRASGKRVVYTTPLLHAVRGADPSSPDPAQRRAALRLALEHLDLARAFGAQQLTVVSGFDPGAAARPEHLRAFAEFLCAVCAEAAPLPVAIEPMDRTIDKRAVVGPTSDAAAVIDRVRAEGHANAGLLIDTGHLPLMGETIQQALEATGDRLQHVHLANCLLRDPSDPLYGDKHPPFEYPGGELGRAELNGLIAALDEFGWFHRPQPTLSFEIRPTVLGPKETLAQHLEWLQEAVAARCDT